MHANFPARLDGVSRLDMTRLTPYHGEGKAVPQVGLEPTWSVRVHGDRPIASRLRLPVSPLGLDLVGGAGGLTGRYSRLPAPSITSCVSNCRGTQPTILSHSHERAHAGRVGSPGACLVSA